MEGKQITRAQEHLSPRGEVGDRREPGEEWIQQTSAVTKPLIPTFSPRGEGAVVKP
jgi:hypothetical protein